VNTTNQVYLYDLQYKTNFLVSHGYNSSAGASGASDWPEISGDGRFIAYRSAATNLVPGATNGVPNLYLYDTQGNSTTLLSVNQFGTGAGDNRSLAPVFSGNSQTLLFQSWASDLVAEDFNQSSDIFACQLFAAGAIPLFSVSISSANGSGQGAWLTWPVIAGRTYQVQFKNTLDDPAWQTLNGDITILGGQGYLNDLGVANGPRFYRVVAF
jgi:Tol biopolymer transport system component